MGVLLPRPRWECEPAESFLLVATVPRRHRSGSICRHSCSAATRMVFILPLLRRDEMALRQDPRRWELVVGTAAPRTTSIEILVVSILRVGGRANTLPVAQDCQHSSNLK